VETLAIAHALRTPLTSIALGLGLLDDGVLGPLNEGQSGVIRTLVGEVARLALLVDRQLDTGHLGSYAGPVDRAPVDFSDLVRRAAVPIERQARDRGIEIRAVVTPGIRVLADHVKLSWVAVSLMGNALRYSPAGGIIDLTLVAVADEARFSVRDRGPGLAPEVQARIFARDGGPGLFLAREIVEAHGGRIEVGPGPADDADDAGGAGSKFTISLPLALGRGSSERP
jgi:signal transduction histidine kinase